MLPELVFARGLKAWRVEWMMGCDFSRNLRSLFPMHPLMSLGIQDLVFCFAIGPQKHGTGNGWTSATPTSELVPDQSWSLLWVPSKWTSFSSNGIETTLRSFSLGPLIPVGVPRWGRWISGALISTPTSTRRKGALPWFCAVPQNDSSWRYSKWDPKRSSVRHFNGKNQPFWSWLAGHSPALSWPMTQQLLSRTCGIAESQWLIIMFPIKAANVWSNPLHILHDVDNPKWLDRLTFKISVSPFLLSCNPVSYCKPSFFFPRLVL